MRGPNNKRASITTENNDYTVFFILISSAFTFGQIPVGNIIKPGAALMKNATGEPSSIKNEKRSENFSIVK